MSGPEKILDQIGTVTVLKPARHDKTHFVFEWLDTIEPQTEAQDFVEGLLTRGGFAVQYGPSNVGKTFAATDLGLHVALGWPWMGREVEQGLVVYVAAEGGFGIRNRVAAFRQHHGIKKTAAPFAVIASPINLLDPEADTEKLIADLKTVTRGEKCEARLIIIDTLSRALAGGEENSSADMGALVKNSDRIRKETGAALLFVHHSGKNESAGARGWSGLRAATDTEISITKDEATALATVTVEKQRDLPKPAAFTFRLRVVEIGTNQRGKPVTSCVVDPSEEAAPAKRPKITGQARQLLDILADVMAREGVTAPPSEHIPKGALVVKEAAWRTAAYARTISTSETPDAKQKAFRRSANDLVRLGHVGKFNEFIWVIR